MGKILYLNNLYNKFIIPAKLAFFEIVLTWIQYYLEL